MKYTVLVIDDTEQTRNLIVHIIEKNTDYEVIAVDSSLVLLEMLEHKDFRPPDLILLDIMMPDLDGIKLAKILRRHKKTNNIPIIFITATTDSRKIQQAFEIGGVDYISKPFYKLELLARVNTYMEVKLYHDELDKKNKLFEYKKEHLEYLVDEKTRKIESITMTMVTALENANLVKDDITGNHIKRVSKYSEFLAREYKCGEDFVKRIKLYSSLHDVGKVGIPDYILKKPGNYTKEEYELMKNHVLYGAQMLTNNDIDIMARNIALYHHEKWDGSGYKAGLKGEKIPLEARIVTLADAYDTITTDRPYKKALSEKKADEIIKQEAGKHFDPRLAKILLKNKAAILKIKHNVSTAK